jgi:hypothetical protein
MSSRRRMRVLTTRSYAADLPVHAGGVGKDAE